MVRVTLREGWVGACPKPNIDRFYLSMDVADVSSEAI